MVLPTFVLLHVGHGLELTLLEYLARVLLHLLALGGVALVVLRLADVAGALRSAFHARRDGGETDT